MSLNRTIPKSTPLNICLLNQTIFQLDSSSWNKFNVALDAPPTDNPRVTDLLSRKAVWKTNQKPIQNVY